MSDRIEGRVARIVDENTVIVNRGEAHGVKRGMKFVIFAEGDEVTDPETGESLGRWEVVKGYVSVVHVQERMSICEGIGGNEEEETPSTLSSAMVKESFQKKKGTLNVNAGEMSGRPAVEPVRVGDKVRVVEG